MENMTLYEFNLLPNQDQYELVFTKGEYVTNREEGGIRFALYAIYWFFVEIEYDIKNNKIVGKRSFITGKLLDKYSKKG